MLSFAYIDQLRKAELLAILPNMPAGSRVLEIGAGSGQQALELERHGYRIDAIDLPSSDYSGHRKFPVFDYDGRTIPFDDGVFDIVYSSNVLEHVSDLARMHAEIKRVLKPGGECIHVIPTHIWRLWTSAAFVPAALRALLRTGRSPGFIDSLRRSGSAALRRHGERGNVLTELWLFHPRWWRRHFRNHGFEIVEERPIGLFYTAQELFGRRLSLNRRRALSQTIGSTTHLYRLKAAAHASAA